MRTRDKEKQSEEGEGKEIRDLELENIVGNLLVAEYQVDRLRTRLNDLINGYRPHIKNNKTSTHVFKHYNKWYKLSLRIDETDVKSTEDNGSNKFTLYS